MDQPLRVIYMGSPAEAIYPLAELLQRGADANCEVVAVVSQPPRPRGRGREQEDPPVAQFARSRSIMLLQPEKASDPIFLRQLTELKPDVIVTAAYGQILNDFFLKVPRLATINIHPSLLPEYRGATPVQAALLDCKTETGVSILFTVKELDAGNIILQKSMPIEPGDTAVELLEKLFRLGGENLPEALRLLAQPNFRGQPQEPSRVSVCRKISKEDGLLRWAMPARELLGRIRAFNPWPGSYTYFRGERLSIVEAREVVAPSQFRDLSPGSWAFSKDDRALVVGCSAESALAILRLKKSGGKTVDAVAFWNGLKQRDGLMFDEKDSTT